MSWKLVTDNDSHWYVIAVEYEWQWDEWLANADVEDEDGTPLGWTVPDFAEAVGGSPSRVEFHADGSYTIA